MAFCLQHDLFGFKDNYGRIENVFVITYKTHNEIRSQILKAYENLTGERPAFQFCCMPYKENDYGIFLLKDEYGEISIDYRFLRVKQLENWQYKSSKELQASNPKQFLTDENQLIRKLIKGVLGA